MNVRTKLPRRLLWCALAAVSTTCGHLQAGTARNGFITEWALLGPFPCSTETCRTNRDTLVAERFIEDTSPSGWRPGVRCGTYTWTAYQSPSNLVDFYALRPGERRTDVVFSAVKGVNLDSTVFYAVSYVYSDADRAAVLFTGSDDFILIWVNEQPVHRYDEARRWVLPCVDRAPIRLRRGWNRILARVANVTGGYAFFVCLADADGSIARSWRTSLDAPVHPPLDTSRVADELLAAGAGKGTGAHHWVGWAASPEPNPPDVTVSVDTGTVLVDDFLGVGVQGDTFYELGGDYALSPDERRLLESRIRTVSPTLVRLFLMTDWWEPQPGVFTTDSPGMRNLYAQLDRFRAALVILTVWRMGRHLNPAHDMRHALPLAQSTARLLQHLIRDRGYTNVRYVTLYNEPDFEFARDGGRTFEDYRRLIRMLDDRLRAEGIRDRVGIMAPDEALSWEWFRDAALTMDDLVDAYESHRYEGYDALAAVPWMQERLGLLRERGIRKPFVIGEFGVWSDGDPYYNGQFIAEYVAAGIRLGVAGFSRWTLQSNPYPGESGMNDWGLWGYRDTGWALRPAYVAHAMLSGTLRAGSRTVSAASSSSKVVAAAALDPEGHLVVLCANRANTTRLTVKGFAPGALVERYVYDRDAAARTDGSLPDPSEMRTDARGEVSFALAGATFAVLRGR